MIVPWMQNQVIISGLQSGAEYDVTVKTLTVAGMSGRMLIVRKRYYTTSTVGGGGGETI